MIFCQGGIVGNTWIVVPVRDNNADIAGIINDLTGGYIVPETYEVVKFNPNTGVDQQEKETVGHPHFGEDAPDFTNKIILVHTKPGYHEIAGTVQLEDFDDLNIYRIWNTGIEYAFNNGADSIVLLNAVHSFDPFIISDAYNILTSENKEVINMGDGAMLMISVNSKLRMDDQFRIWYGDNDFYRRAAEVSGYFRANWSNLILLDKVEFDEEFNAIVAEDGVKYDAKWS